ncbi:MAG TPA: glutamine--fructose-6-phosphate aminotransferase, partial [Gammaproteobacteria bacterium]|nr:glutamine--fructose-6-phosphate aminotransferase [Gammaproteobacteria bacterium]
MCGIIGAIAGRNITDILVEGLKRLEYRGYDSAGVALLDQQGGIRRQRVTGRVKNLQKMLRQNPAVAGQIGIAHTRWATHGEPSEKNAHPHMCNDVVALVHNGIIENHEALREQQEKEDYRFTSNTDTEVIVHQIHRNLLASGDLFKAMQQTV